METILVIESNPCVQELLHEELSAGGYSVATTDEISFIKDLLTSTEPDLVIFDIYFHREPRWDLLQEIRDKDPDLPVVIFSGYGGYAKDPRSSLANGFVLKSLFFEELKNKIGELLSHECASQQVTTEKRVFPNSALPSTAY